MVTFGKELDREKVAAEFHHGVLRLHFPKVGHVKPRKIEVQVA
jgi:HSP20 family protein